MAVSYVKCRENWRQLPYAGIWEGAHPPLLPLQRCAAVPHDSRRPWWRVCKQGAGSGKPNMYLGSQCCVASPRLRSNPLVPIGLPPRRFVVAAGRSLAIISEKKRKGVGMGGEWLICPRRISVRNKNTLKFKRTPSLPQENALFLLRAESICAAGAGGACGIVRGCSALVFAALICASVQHWTATGTVILRTAEGSWGGVRWQQHYAAFPAARLPAQFSSWGIKSAPHVCACIECDLALDAVETWSLWSLARQMPLTAKATCAPLLVCCASVSEWEVQQNK